MNDETFRYVNPISRVLIHDSQEFSVESPICNENIHYFSKRDDNEENQGKRTRVLQKMFL